MSHPDHVIIKTLKKIFLFVKTNYQGGVLLSEVRYCPKCFTVRSALLSEVRYCPKCVTVRSALLSEVRCCPKCVTVRSALLG